MFKMSPRTLADLSWYMRDAQGAVSGLKAQVYERSGGTCSTDPERITDRQLDDADKYRRLDKIRERLLTMDAGALAWGDLLIAYGHQPRWILAGDLSLSERGVMPPELLRLAPHAPTALQRGAELHAQGCAGLVTSLTQRLQSLEEVTPAPPPPRLVSETETQWAITAIRQAASSKKNAPWITQVRMEARDMLESATHLYEVARRELADEARKANELPAVDPIAAMYALLERMGQTV